MTGLVARLANPDSSSDPLLESLSDDIAVYGANDLRPFTERRIQETTQLLLPHSEEYTQFIRGLLLSASASWQGTRASTNYEERLFAVPELLPRLPHYAEEDRLNLSGVAGLGLRHRPEVRGILSKEGFRDFGFLSRVDAASFVGAWVISGLHERQEKLRSMGSAGYTYQSDTDTRTILLGGDFHGDFRMSEVVESKRGGITPLNRFAEFSPKEVISVAGYHSIETSFTDAMLEVTFLTEGEQGLRQIITEFTQLAHVFMEQQGGLGGSGALSGFADYGGSGMSSLNDCIWLYMYKNDAYKHQLGRPGEVRPLYSAPYLPGSSVSFELHGDTDGIYAGMSEKGAQYKSIHIPREHFGTLFYALLEQAGMGLGRTSPAEHVNVITGCLEMLDESTD